MKKWLVTGYYCETWKLLVEADTKEEAEDYADANLFDEGIEADGFLDDMEIEEVADDFNLLSGTTAPIEEIEVRAPTQTEFGQLRWKD